MLHFVDVLQMCFCNIVLQFVQIFKKLRHVQNLEFLQNMKNSQSKLVTVVIPTFKRAGKLKKALRSVMLQSFKNFDVIVVDDNTNNEESAKVRKICISNNVNYIKNFRKKGGCGSRNSALLSTSSKYIAFLDDDDLWLANKLKVQFDFLNKNINFLIHSKLPLITIEQLRLVDISDSQKKFANEGILKAVSYTHLRAHET